MDNIEVSQEEIKSYMLLDWAKAHEQAKCFEEEVDLRVEEMRRTLHFFSWKATEWTKHGELGGFGDKCFSDDVIQGLRAYALCQSAMYRGLIKVFVSDWHPSLVPKGLGAEWLPEYSDLVVIWKGWNKIPSIILSTFTGPDAEPDNVVLLELDEALDQAEEGTHMEQDEESELRDTCVQIFWDN